VATLCAVRQDAQVAERRKGSEGFGGPRLCVSLREKSLGAKKGKGEEWAIKKKKKPQGKVGFSRSKETLVEGDRKKRQKAPGLGVYRKKQRRRRGRGT